MGREHNLELGVLCFAPHLVCAADRPLRPEILLLQERGCQGVPANLFRCLRETPCTPLRFCCVVTGIFGLSYVRAVGKGGASKRESTTTARAVVITANAGGT
jgi:hypothetical protein